MPEKSCYQRAVDLLSRRAHFSAELRMKLSRRGFEDSEIAQAVERLEQEGYIDDRQTAQLWVEQQLARKAQGPRKLLAGLMRKGLDAELAQLAVEHGIDDEETLARDASERWLARSPHSGAPGLARHLERMGFRTGIAVRMVQEHRQRLDGGA